MNPDESYQELVTADFDSDERQAILLRTAEGATIHLTFGQARALEYRLYALRRVKREKLAALWPGLG